MLNPSISRYDVPELDSLPDDIRERILAVQEKAGFVPNVFATLAHRPDEFRAFFAYHDALMEREGSTLSAAEKEMIVVATSAANGCEYCVVAHGALVRLFSKEKFLADQVAINHRHAPITPRQKAMLDFAMKVARTPEQIEQNDYETLYQHDYTDEDIWDITGISGFFGLSNRMAIVSGMRPNEEFFTMGRIPRTR